MPQIMGTFHSYYFCTVTTAIMVLNVFIIKNACSFGYKRENREELEGGVRKQRGKIRAERKTRKKHRGNRENKKETKSSTASQCTSISCTREKKTERRERLERKITEDEHKE
jgi:hypothetical protein